MLVERIIIKKGRGKVRERKGKEGEREEEKKGKRREGGTILELNRARDNREDALTECESASSSPSYTICTILIKE
jgi:hypothetical protein